jgi:uncharacterized protein YdeI (BOF family)
VDDRYVVLVGKVTKKYKDETYFFTDGAGTTIAVRSNIDPAFLGIGKPRST